VDDAPTSALKFDAGTGAACGRSRAQWRKSVDSQPGHETAEVAISQLDRSKLPIRQQPFRGVANRTLDGSQLDWNAIGHVTAPDRAPNVLVVLIDDAGFGNSATFGGPIDTPNYSRMADHALSYNRSTCLSRRCDTPCSSEGRIDRVMVSRVRAIRPSIRLRGPSAACGALGGDSFSSREAREQRCPRDAPPYDGSRVTTQLHSRSSSLAISWSPAPAALSCGDLSHG
jgi:hypothetical protein